MNPFAPYRAINTKIYARRKTLLSQKEWEKLAESRSVTQIIEFLKKRPGYKEVVNSYKAEELHRTDLEVILDRYVVKEIERMLHYFSGSYKEFFKTLLMEYEISDLLLLSRSISGYEEIQDINRFFIHSEHYALANFNHLVGCKNLTQFIEALRGTPYYEVLKTLNQEDTLKQKFHMEMKLYILFYKQIMEKAAKLTPTDQKIVSKLVGTKADLINIQWIYRAIKYYDISPEEILIYSLPVGNRTTYKKLKALTYTKSLQELRGLATKYLAYPVFEEEKDAFLTKRMDKYIYEYALKMEDNRENISTSLTYLYILNIEKEDLIALTEGIRYTLPENELKEYLVHTI
ncbi:V-type ATPase subunit [Sporanaerobium hydrogeniformans]|uniref:V-type ATPase subunit n=1 Tax=Sporanaerobium hydrogeniformans TaxID=3072179 RepID=UPI0015D4C860|nr:V-type ATPase subunit [Sporanaerobium hydrogeniformans]